MVDNIKRHKSLLSDDLVSAILVRLPVKSLIRFTCVSKSWNSMIRDPIFIAAHSEAYNKEDCGSRRRYLLHMPDDSERISQFLTSTFLTSASAAKRRLKQPFPQHQIVAGSCEGLVCLYTAPQVVGLWNPLLQIFKILPPPPSCLYNEEPRLVFGLGYSRKDKDHRVVRILYTNKKKDISANKVDIYSMKSNSWKSIECPAPLLVCHDTGVVVNGRINWMAFQSPRIRPSSSFTVMWFDIDKESFGQAVQSWDVCGLEWLQSPFVKEVLRLQEHEEYRRLSSNLWKMKTLACENSWLKLSTEWGEKRVNRVTLFDGEMMLPTYCDDLISFLGISVDGMPWEEENDSAPSWRKFQIVCVSESLRLLDLKM